MWKIKTSLEKHRDIIILTALIILGTVLRISACYWGYPYQLHADEGHTVNSAIDLISRHSYEVGVYDRPDHFEIKCYAVLFQIVSYFKYHMSADAAFSLHQMAFYLIARAYTSFFGILTIGLTYKIVEKIRPKAKLIVAGLVTFFPVFVVHSAYATPDIVLTFFVLLITYLSILYLETLSMKYLTLMCIITGIGITVKYTCAIACIWIAIVICIDCIKNKNYLGIVKIGIFSIAVVFFACFFCAPNLFTNISKTIERIHGNAGSTHLGADGLNFWGNFEYYFYHFLGFAGYETLICILAGILFCLKNKNINTLSMGMGLIFWVCTSALALHWERWGMPIYTFFVILEAIGISYLFDSVQKKWMKPIVGALVFIILCNTIISGLLVVRNMLVIDARVDAVQFCENNGITKDNTLYDGYTPFKLNEPSTINVSIDMQNNIKVPSGIQYLIISGGMYNRYYAESERYVSQVNMYENIQNKNHLIYSAGIAEARVPHEVDNYLYGHSNIGIINIVRTIYGLLSDDSDLIGGNRIKIYRILGDALTLGDFEIAYIGDQHPVLNENNHTLKIKIISNNQNHFYLNSNRYKLSYHMYDTSGNLVDIDGVKTDFESFTGSAEIDMEVDITEKGLYTLEIDVVQDGIAWLSQLGMQTQKIEVEIQ